MKNILNNLIQEFKKGTILNKLIYINVGLFLLFSILGVFSFMFQFDLNPILKRLYLPAENSKLLSQPWTFITYMFLHNNFLHLLFNMIWLHFAGKIFLQYLNPKKLLSTYMLGGISGGLLFIIAYNYLPALTIYTQDVQALGASAAVLAIVVAIATYIPNYSVRLPFIGSVKLKHIAIFSVILDILSIPKGNAGGHIAHLGGAIFGYFYIKQLQKGNDYSIGFIKWINYLATFFKPKRKFRTVHKRSKSDTQFNKEKAEQQKAVNLVLEKISKSGYESLNTEEKATLFSASKK
ncbi:rhomboid family intramembrane serine protease [Flavobacteriales bacterium]|nr:rhomboid family intramembrane serine protease [Flavobacteriales bacterium]